MCGGEKESERAGAAVAPHYQFLLHGVEDERRVERERERRGKGREPRSIWITARTRVLCARLKAPRLGAAMVLLYSRGLG